MSQSMYFPDQSHINQVRDALWERPNGRASIMVGAGFSRNAETADPGVGDIPLWQDIARQMFRKLYPQSADADAKEVHNTLRLAQEYETGFGRSDLHKFLQELIRDNEFSPSDMHQRLLRLPWRDVFTTNWDTLLERTTPHITEQAYSLIQNTDEIPLKSQPRIVKLHGSLPSQFPLIFTEEDYRTYPIKFAPFLNTVQQAMMETVFCLVGFSGDDPNFLQWSGWVRDNLGPAAPKIYLAGWLNLSNHRRRMLEDRGVVPIDLARHPKSQQWPDHLRHKYAAQWVLHTLENGKPYEQTTWPSPPIQEKLDVPEYLQPVEALVSTAPQIQPKRKWNSEDPFDEKEELARVRETIKVWKHNRSSYPGWLVFPSGPERGELRRRTSDWEPPILNGLPELTSVERLYAIRELVWRREILLEPFTQQLVRASEEVLQLIDCEKRTIDGIVQARNDWTDIREAWRVIALALLTDARLGCNRALFEQRLNALEPFADDHINVAHRLKQERCLWDIFSLNFESLNQQLDNWEVVNCDPIWILRKAALLTESGRINESKPLVQTALNLIRENYARQSSIANASREGWALGSALIWENQHSFRTRWNTLTLQKCNAFQEISLFSRRIQGDTERNEAPAFDLGSSRNQGIHISFNIQDEFIAAYSGLRLMEVGGLPPTNNPSDDHPRMPISITNRILTLATDKLSDDAPDLAIRLVLRFCTSDRDKTLDRVLARTRIARLSEDSARTLAEICEGVIKYARRRLTLADTPPLLNPWVLRIRVSLEVLSRLVLRLPSKSVATFLELSLNLLRKPEVGGNFLLGRSVSNLLRRSWEALPDEYRAPYALRLLAMPLEKTDGFAQEHGYLNHVSLVMDSDISLIRSTSNEDEFRKVLNLAISEVKSKSPLLRDKGLFRLLALVNSECLTRSEANDIANAIWEKTNPLIHRKGLNDWLLLALPELTPSQAEQSFRKKWLTPDSDSDKEIDWSGETLQQVGLALNISKRHGSSLSLSPKEQEYLGNCILKVAENWPLLKGGVRSTISKIELSENVAQQLYEMTLKWQEPQRSGEYDPFLVYEDHFNQSQTKLAYAVMLGLIRAMPDRVEDISSWIRLGLTSDDDLQVSQAMSTLQSWISAHTENPNSVPKPYDDLVREIGVVIATRRKVALENALSVANWVFESGDTSHQEAIGHLVLQGLSYLIEELRYDRQHDNGNRVPNLRRLCAQLAKSMSQKGYADSPIISQWLEEAKHDPLPEVRHIIAPDK